MKKKINIFPATSPRYIARIMIYGVRYYYNNNKNEQVFGRSRTARRTYTTTVTSTSQHLRGGPWKRRPSRVKTGKGPRRAISSAARVGCGGIPPPPDEPVPNNGLGRYYNPFPAGRRMLRRRPREYWFGGGDPWSQNPAWAHNADRDLFTTRRTRRPWEDPRDDGKGHCLRFSRSGRIFRTSCRNRRRSIHKWRRRRSVYVSNSYARDDDDDDGGGGSMFTGGRFKCNVWIINKKPSLEVGERAATKIIIKY